MARDFAEERLVRMERAIAELEDRVKELEDENTGQERKRNG